MAAPRDVSCSQPVHVRRRRRGRAVPRRSRISHLCSPYSSGAGEPHGYDVVDHSGQRDSAGSGRAHRWRATRLGMIHVLDISRPHGRQPTPGVGGTSAPRPQQPVAPYFDGDWDPLRPASRHGALPCRRPLRPGARRRERPRARRRRFSRYTSTPSLSNRLAHHAHALAAGRQERDGVTQRALDAEIAA